MNRFVARASFALALSGVVLFPIASCSGDRPAGVEGSLTGADASTPMEPLSVAKTPSPPSRPGYNAGPADTSRSVIQRGPRVEISRAESSLALRALPSTKLTAEEEDFDHEPGRLRRPPASPLLPGGDPVLQSDVPVASMPATILNFLGQGNTSSPATMGGTPPDTNGAVGPNHFVQTVNTGLAVWNKSGTIAAASKKINALWTGYVGTNAGNGCAANNNGDPVVVYDQVADRWFITQFSLPNVNSGPNYQCVAVSKTADPTGEYWLYDYRYVGLNDYGKFGIWPDAYYATFNMFGGGFGGDADICAYDRVAMLSGLPAAQHCFQQSGPSGLLPVSLDGHVKPPIGEPGFIAGLGSTVNDSIDIWKFHTDWVTPANATLTGPTTLPVATFSALCGGGACVPQKSPGNQLASLADRAMFRLSYRNFGTHQSLLMNHSVAANGAGGVRWYEIRSPNGTPVVFQQGTYAPNDGNWRWMGSIAMDQAQNMALGFSVSSGTTFPSIGWTGRLVGDSAGAMGQGEAIIDVGSGVETGNFSNGQLAQRWGDYSNMTVDPVDDCTFWYSTELYHTTGPIPKTWDTQIASIKFPSCAVNDFSIAVAPASQSVAPGSQVTYTVTTAAIKGTAEAVILNIQDLPTGVTGAFNPGTVTAGATSTLTLTAAANAPLTTSPAPTFTVIGKAPSAVHPATAQIAVATCGAVGATCCASAPACTGAAPDSCHGPAACNAATNKCENPVLANGTACNNGNLCQTGQVCTNGTCAGTPVVCQPLDGCHVAGTCTPGTGVCTNPNATDGTACTSANKCLASTTCTAGVCGGGTAKVCTAQDQCHVVGTCDSATGNCSNPNKTDGTACTSTDKCLTNTTCTAGACGGTGVACTAQDECHDVGTCDSSSGACSNPIKADGTPCSIGTCNGGTCTHATADAGTDSGAGGNDAGHPTDSGARDSGTTGGGDASAADSGDTGGTGTGGGCGCRTAQSENDSPALPLAGFGALGLIGAVRLRRRARVSRA